jgi:hypothetical protein
MSSGRFSSGRLGSDAALSRRPGRGRRDLACSYGWLRRGPATLGSVDGIGRGRGNEQQRRVRARGIAALLLAMFAAVVVGCGGSDGTQSTSVAPPGVKFETAKKVKIGVPRAKVIRELGDPVLTSKAVKGSPGGCLYYPMEGRPLADLFQYCLDEHKETNLAATAYSLDARQPPSDASAARQALIGRGDVICSVSGGLSHLPPPEKLVHQLKEVTTKSAPAARQGLAALMRKFSNSAEKTRAQLEAFNAPPDELSELRAYEAALGQQAAALDRAATALAAGDAKSYDKELQRAEDLGDEAKAHASQYGFAQCAGLKLS